MTEAERDEAKRAIAARKRLEAAVKAKRKAEMTLTDARREFEVALIEAQPYYTYEDLAEIAGLSRIRIGQLLREIRQRMSILGP